MKFMVHFQLKPGSRQQVIDVFELRGPNRNPGVSFRGAWIDSSADHVFVLVESAEQQLVVQAAHAWGEHGKFDIHPVTDIEQF